MNCFSRAKTAVCQNRRQQKELVMHCFLLMAMKEDPH